MKDFYKRIEKIKDGIGSLKKTADGYNYKYAELIQIQEKLKPLLKEQKLTMTQPPLMVGDKTVLHTNFTDFETGETITACQMALPSDVKPQDVGSAVTYFRRYSLVAFFDLEVEDDDGASATGKPKSKAQVVASNKKVAEESKAVQDNDGSPF